jgi:hypothetical protein
MCGDKQVQVTHFQKGMSSARAGQNRIENIALAFVVGVLLQYTKRRLVEWLEEVRIFAGRKNGRTNYLSTSRIMLTSL